MSLAFRWPCPYKHMFSDSDCCKHKVIPFQRRGMSMTTLKPSRVPGHLKVDVIYHLSLLSLSLIFSLCRLNAQFLFSKDGHVSKVATHSLRFSTNLTYLFQEHLYLHLPAVLHFLPDFRIAGIELPDNVIWQVQMNSHTV